MLAWKELGKAFGETHNDDEMEVLSLHYSRVSDII